VSARSNATTAEPDQDADTEEWIRGLGRLERDYRPGRLRADVVLFRTHETVRYTGSDTLGWDRYVAGELEALDVPGGHLSMLLEPHMQLLAREVASRIERVQVRLS
jgi:thioesterase domain-containing protein